MPIDFEYLYNKYKLNIKGVIHVGAHWGQEYQEYLKFNIENIIMFEPHPETFKILMEKINNPNVILINKALGHEVGKLKMYTETGNCGQANSLLVPKLHKNQYTWITFNNEIIVDVDILDNYTTNNQYNFINMDTQGYELMVLKGADKTLENIDYIYTEVNRAELYENCVFVEELDSFLLKYGFERVETDWIGDTWGDAFYIKNNI